MTERITCKSYCNCWNDTDKDCELYGEHHPCPRKCPHFMDKIYWIDCKDLAKINKKSAHNVKKSHKTERKV